MKVNVQYISEQGKKLQIKFWSSEFSKTVELTESEIEEAKTKFEDDDFLKRILFRKYENTGL